MLIEALFFMTSMSSAITRHADLMEYLHKNTHDRYSTDRAKVLDEYSTKIIEYIDGIPHYKLQDLSTPDAEKVRDIENEFRRLIAMKSVKYVYKRNLHWRTWRKVKMHNGVDKVVSYKCNNHLRKNLTSCDNCGLWTLEESPPCPVEIFSMINNAWICVHDYVQPQEDLNDNCPTMIKFSDLSPTCDNPIETTFRFTSKFDDSEKHNVICDAGYYCEIFTTYLISKTNIAFRIISSENNIIYSRIMKSNNANYICINNCGHYDRHTKIVTKLDVPMKLSLTPSRKHKRDLTGLKHKSMIDTNLMDNHLTAPKDKQAGKIFNSNVPSKTLDIKELDYLSLAVFPKSTTESICNKVKNQQEFYEEYYNNYQDDLL